MADEIPLSDAEKAFFDAMNAGPETEVAAPPTAADAAGAAEGSSKFTSRNVSVEPSAAASESNGASAVPVQVPSGEKDASATPSLPTTPQVAISTNTSPPPQQKTTIGKRKRLPQDVVGQFEDRIAEDPKGDVDAWLGLIEEYKRKGKFDDARAVYERFFVVFPTAADQWMAYIKMELNNNEFIRTEQLFSRCLLSVMNVELWGLYLDYIRRRNDLTNDPTGKLRGIVSQAYDFVLNNIGHDREAGRIWQDQIAFVKSAPGVVGGSNWMDQQKMDSLRRVYQKAICMPVTGVEAMWKEYDAFEQGLNKMTARKFLQERSPAFMTARGCLIELSNLTRGLRRETLPRLPPAPGSEGEDDWNEQVSLWMKWLKWEKEDPLVIANEDPVSFRNRIIYAYKQALMAMRFWPEFWYEAAEFCFSNELGDQGMNFLKDGLAANPESCLLTFRYAERLESTAAAEDGEQAAIRKGQVVRKPYDDLLNCLYGLYAKQQVGEKEELEKLEEEFTSESPGSPGSQEYDDDDDEAPSTYKTTEKERKSNEIKEKSKASLLSLSKVISAVWINLMRAMRRIQGHGRVNEALGGSRQIFADARKRGKIISDVYIASALIEYHCYRDPAALRIFERGMKLFPEDEDFALEYLKHLVNINDITNARAMFETFVSKVPPSKCRRVYEFFHSYEAHYGDLSQVYKLEQRMRELYPSDPLPVFSSRYSYHAVDPTLHRPLISASQLSAPPRAQHQRSASPYSPPPQQQQQQRHPLPTRVASPKRPAPVDNADENRARKLPRADSPLKGAAGRRLKLMQQAAQKKAASSAPVAPVAGGGGGDRGGLPESVLHLLSIIPSAEKYNAVRFKPEAMVGLLAGLTIPNSGGGGGTYY